MRVTFINSLHKRLSNQDPEAMDQSLSDALIDDDDDKWTGRSHAVRVRVNPPASLPVCIPSTVLTESPVVDGVYRRWDSDDFVCNDTARNTALSAPARHAVDPKWSVRRSRAFPATPKPQLQRGTSTRVAVLDTIFDPASHRLSSKLSRFNLDGMLFLQGVSVKQCLSC